MRKLLLTAITSKKGRKIIGTALLILFSPLIIVLLLLVALLDGGTKNNTAVADYIFKDQALQYEITDENKAVVDDMSKAIKEIELLHKNLKVKSNADLPDLLQMKCIFFTLFIGTSVPETITEYVNSFVVTNEQEYVEARLLSQVYLVLEETYEVDINQNVLANVAQMHSYLLYGVAKGLDGINGTSALPPKHEGDAIVTGEPVEEVISTILEESKQSDRPKEGMSSPIENWKANVSSGYGKRPYPLDPTGQTYDFHTGLDLSSPQGTPIKAVLPGTVRFVRYNDYGYGYHVMVDHGGGLMTIYAHSSSILVMEGQKVEQGEVLALVGMTGAATGPHLHFEVWEDGLRQEPSQYLP